MPVMTISGTRVGCHSVHLELLADGKRTEHTRHAIQAHNNAIFDVTWSLDDKLVSTASGDQTAKLFDVETAQCVSVLAGHESTVKSVAWDPCNPRQ